jgi:hypothetical protein
MCGSGIGADVGPCGPVPPARCMYRGSGIWVLRQLFPDRRTLDTEQHDLPTRRDCPRLRRRARTQTRNKCRRHLQAPAANDSGRLKHQFESPSAIHRGTARRVEARWSVKMIGSMFRSREDELGKKDDDHRPTKTSPIRAQWTAATGAPRRKLLKRLAIVLALAAFVYFFIRNLPTDLPVRDRRRPVYMPQLDKDEPRAPAPIPGAMPKLKPDHKPKRPLPPRPPSSDEPPSAGYSGPLKFEHLLPSLQAVYSTGGSSAVNRNVLFAAASLKSAALLLPMACNMGLERRNYVHFALVGGSEITMEKLRAVNGIGDHCEIIFHDARPDFPTKSSTERLKRSVARALCKSIPIAHESL